MSVKKPSLSGTYTPSYSMISLGCARSLVDSEAMINQLNTSGFNMVPLDTSEEITVLNTCSFIQDAIDETEANINMLLEKKAEGVIKHVVVSGCYPSRYKRAKLEEKFPDVDLWFTTKEEHLLAHKLSELMFQVKFQPSASVPYVKLTPSHYTYLKISEGCDNWCTFCTIPKIRGTHTSRSIEDIVAQCEQHIAMGAKEFLLIAEDTTAWGEDLFGTPDFPKLLRALGKLDVPWIRPMYIFPSRVTDELIETLATTANITRYIDIPIQHVNTRLLEAMNRRHDKAFLIDMLTKMRAQIKGLVIRTTFILGFPGETEEDVQELCEFITAYPFEHIGCFTYSKEHEAKSARFEDQVPLDVAQARVDKVMKHQYSLIQQRHPKRLGETVEVIYDGNRIARSYREAPEVDSVIILDETPNLIPGQFYTAKITGFDGYDLLAEVV